MVYYLTELVELMLTGLPIYVILRFFYLRHKHKKNNNTTDVNNKWIVREIFMSMFVLFMFALFTFVSLGEYSNLPGMLQLAKERIGTGEGINLVPFRTIRNYYKHSDIFGELLAINIAGNILIFIPWGFGTMFLWRKNRKWYKLVLFSLLLPMAIEFMQLFINRQVDIDDVLLNFSGGMIGGIIFWITYSRWIKYKKKKK